MEKICQLINDRYCWRLIVDGMNIPFQGSMCAEFFARHFKKLGYSIKWDRNRWKENPEWLEIDRTKQIRG